jgi:hypothetical protein
MRFYQAGLLLWVSLSFNLTLFDNILLQALDECDYVALFGLRTLNFARVAAACPRKTF